MPVPYTLKKFREIAASIGAVEKAIVSEFATPQFVIQTTAGPLMVTPYEDFLACRFQDVAAARTALGVREHSFGSRLNPYSGKWNWLHREGVPHGTRRTKANYRAGLDAMLPKFVAEVQAFRALLIPVTKDT